MARLARKERLAMAHAGQVYRDSCLLPLEFDFSLLCIGREARWSTEPSPSLLITAFMTL